MKRLVLQFEPSVALYQDTNNGIAWIEDGRSGIGISVHPNIDVTGSVRGMKQRGYWGKNDRTVRSHGWIYNVDRLSYDKSDTLECVVANACMCIACAERKFKYGLT